MLVTHVKGNHPVKRRCALLAVFPLVLAMSTFLLCSEREGHDATYGKTGPAIRVATGSLGELGLLRALAEPFCEANQCRIYWLKKGSGASLKALKEGRAELAMVHAPAAEEEALEQGWATTRTLVGSNEFYIIGPKSDPAGVADASCAADAYLRIARAEAKFLSRGDNSGTHQKETMIWELAGIQPHGSWYIMTKDFMKRTLMRADKELGYFMTDSSTFLATQHKIKNLRILFKGDPVLVNLYHALVAAPDRFPGPNRVFAAKFVEYMTSPHGQQILRDYGKEEYGTPLYNDAAYARSRTK
jgi:tungstate transport system substrate-binding protein